MRNALWMATPSPCHTVLSTFLAQESAAQLKRRLPASPPVSVKSSIPAFLTCGRAYRESCAACPDRYEMWMGVVKVIAEPEIDAICLTSEVGRSGRENHEPADCGVVGKAAGSKSST